MPSDWKEEFATPLQRLAILPTMISWAGEWNAIDEYFKNNIVTDPITTGSYIYTGFSAAIRGGLPPSQVIGPSIWTAFGATVASGVQRILGSDGILVDGSDTAPTVSNLGVVTVETDGGIANVGTAQFPVLVLNGTVSQVQAGLGISVTSTAIPKITNTGILNILPGEGISVSGEGEVTLANTGVVSIAPSPGTLLTVSPGQNPAINSTGAISITPGTGIALEPGRPSNEPRLKNTGVISIVPRNIQVLGGFPASGDKQLGMINPVKSLVFNSQPLVMIPNSLPIVGSTALIAVTQTPGTFWANVMQNGPPAYANTTGTTFMLDFSLKFTSTASGGNSTNLIMYLQDNTGGSVKEIGPFIARAGAIGTSTQVPNRIYLFAPLIVKVEQARAQGFRTLTGLRVTQTASLPNNPPVIILASSGPCSATWFNQSVPFPT